MALTVPGLEQNYLYGQYAQGGSVPFGGLTVSPRVTPTTSNGSEYGISIPQNYAYTTDGFGNNIAMGQDGNGLKHMSQAEMAFKGINNMFIA